MIKKIYSKHIIDEEDDIKIDVNLPDICPHCGTAIYPTILSSKYFLNKNNNKDVFVFYFCTKCKKASLSEYVEDTYEEQKYYRVATHPKSNLKVKHSEETSELSPEFVKIYDESYLAEQANLYEICGMGYRKAVEFLIKDFAIKIYPNDSNKIKKLPLSKCISDYINSERIKALALASAWIGNDETHYYKQHKDYNLDSMKAFINAMVNFIDSELQAIKANELIQSLHG